MHIFVLFTRCQTATNMSFGKIYEQHVFDLFRSVFVQKRKAFRHIVMHGRFSDPEGFRCRSYRGVFFDNEVCLFNNSCVDVVIQWRCSPSVYTMTVFDELCEDTLPRGVCKYLFRGNSPCRERWRAQRDEEGATCLRLPRRYAPRNDNV